MTSPQIKICGITNIEDALICAEAGVHAVGFVFYPPSPRYISDERACEISRALPKNMASVGVFVDADQKTILQKASDISLDFVQLHGQESPAFVAELKASGLKIIKTLFINKQPSLDQALLYDVSAFLVEASGGELPGGNALTWDWGGAAALSKKYPVILAGGLSPDNVALAVKAARPAAVDVSSGVEVFPGKKDRDKINLFIKTIASCHFPSPLVVQGEGEGGAEIKGKVF